MDSTKKCRFTGDELAVLDNYRDSWKNATRPKRTEIAGKAWEEIKQLNNKFVNDEPGKKLKKKVCLGFIGINFYEPHCFCDRGYKLGFISTVENENQRRNSNFPKGGTAAW